MIQRAVLAMIGVVIGLLVTFAVFSAILGGLDGFYLLTQDACNYGTENRAKRTVRIAPEVFGNPGDSDAIDWTTTGLDVYENAGICGVDVDDLFATYLTPTGDEFLVRPPPFGTELVDRSFTVTPGYPSLVFDGKMAAHSDVIYFHRPFLPNYLEAHAVGTWAADDDADLTLLPDNANLSGLWVDASTVYVADSSLRAVLAYDRTTGAANSSLHYDTTLHAATSSAPLDLWSDGIRDYILFDDGMIREFNRSDQTHAGIAVDESVLDDAGNDNPAGLWSNGNTVWVVDSIDQRIYAYDLQTGARAGEHDLLLDRGGGNRDITSADGNTLLVSGRSDNDTVVRFYSLVIPDGDSDPYQWLPAEPVFIAQRQLVTLLAVIAAIGMPIGAMTAIVFFGQALVLQRRFKEGCLGMREGRRAAWRGSVWLVRCIPGSAPATAATHPVRTVPGAASP